MTDKDMTERTVFKELFPGVHLLLCAFHTLRSFKREVSCEKLGITPGQRSVAREILQKMVYAKSEAEYSMLYEQLESTASKTVVDYFKNNWHNIKSEWTLGMMFKTGNFLNSTNNRLENFNSKLKSIIPAYSSLQSFVENLYVLLSCIRRERQNKAGLMIQKVPTSPHSPGSPAARYFSFLTPYAFKFVLKQLSLIETVKEVHEEGSSFLVVTSDDTMSVNAKKCDCLFNSSMRLPCRHIFAVRKMTGQDMFSEELCDQRWGRASYFSSQQMPKSNEASLQATLNAVEAENEIAVFPPKRVLSTHEKFRKASKLATQIASVVAEVSNIHFERRIQFLQNVLEAWESGKEIGLQTVYEETVGSEYDVVATADEAEVSLQSEETFSENEALNTKPVLKEVDGNTGTYINQPSSTTVVRQDMVTLPLKIRMRGRPKGISQTVIGLPQKKGKVSSSACKRPTPFVNKHYTDREKIMLNWFVDSSVVERVLRDKSLIDEKEVECIPEKVHNATVKNENVDLNQIRKYFTSDGWKAVMSVVESKLNSCSWLCPVCYCDLDSTKSAAIACDSCLYWYNYECAGIKRKPKSKAWFCRNCYASTF